MVLTRAAEKAKKKQEGENTEEEPQVGEKRALPDETADDGEVVTAADEEEQVVEDSEPSTKKAKVDNEDQENEDPNAASSKPAKDDQMDIDEDAEDTTLQNGILEKGHIYFFYRTKIDHGLDNPPSSIDDIARLHILLVPRPSGESKGHFRIMVIGKKRLPDSSKGREVFWGSVEKYGDDLEALQGNDGLGEKNYSTKTRGDRHIEPARLAGRGHYALYSPEPPTPSKRATHLAYHMSHPSPSELGPVQEALSIYPSGSAIIQVKNPTSSSNPRGASLAESKRADYPDEIIDEVFGGDADGKGRKFVPANPISLLNYDGAEILMIAEGKNAGEVLEKKDEKELAQIADREAKKLSSHSVLEELKLDEETFPCNALEGDWI